ncbi:hypothetical protein QFZ43_000121 [Streptomyces afghaniensis]|nr:hypothetical protein [Streptomyces afghaniensis]
MAVLGPVVEVLRLTVLDAGHDFSVGGAVGAEPVGDDHPRHRVRLLHQAAEEAPGRGLVPAVLHEDVQDVAVLVDGPPQVLRFSIDLDEDLVQVPFVCDVPVWCQWVGAVTAFQAGVFSLVGC